MQPDPKGAAPAKPVLQTFGGCFALSQAPNCPGPIEVLQAWWLQLWSALGPVKLAVPQLWSALGLVKLALPQLWVSEQQHKT